MKREKIGKRFSWIAFGVLLVEQGVYVLLFGLPSDLLSVERLGFSIAVVGGGLIMIWALIAPLEKCVPEGCCENRKSEPPSCVPPAGSLDKKAYKYVWDWAVRQDQHTFDQFGLGIVGIGALFFAYGSIDVHNVQILVAFIGLGGSLILWDHMYGARQEYYSAKKIVMMANPTLSGLFDQMDMWREKFRAGRYLYQPASRLMTYFMALVSGAWTAVILSLLGLPLYPWNLVVCLLFVLFATVFIVVRRLQGNKN